MLFYGSAGVGKTCTKEIIAGDTPPDTRQSTPLATRLLHCTKLMLRKSYGRNSHPMVE